MAERSAEQPIDNNVDITADTGSNVPGPASRVRRTPEQPRTRETARITAVQIAQMINELTDSVRFRELFEVGYGTEQRPNPHRFRKTLARAVNKQVHHMDSWGQVAGLVADIVDDLPIASRLNMAVLGSLYLAQRIAAERTIKDFMRRDFTEDIDLSLQESQRKAVEGLAPSVANLHLQFSQIVFAESIFRR